MPADADIELILRFAGNSAVAPVWDVGSASLLWVDDQANTVHRLHPGSGVETETALPQGIGAASPRMNGGLVCNLRDGIGLRDPDDRLTWLVYWQRDGRSGSVAAVDPAGRLWAATVRDDGEAGGQLIRVQPDGRATVVLEGLEACNGIGWNADADRLYLVDSATERIDILDYDLTSGQVGDRRPLCAVTDGIPNGLCVDADGAVWVAVPGDGSQIRRYTKDGRLDRTLVIPADRVTGCCFGGPDFTDLYATSSGRTGGSLFVMRGVGAGLPTPRFPG